MAAARSRAERHFGLCIAEHTGDIEQSEERLSIRCREKQRGRCNCVQHTDNEGNPRLLTPDPNDQSHKSVQDKHGQEVADGRNGDPSQNVAPNWSM
jgi:hypothetical protein